jgi:TetR/AcrR family transcriptional regulator, regulator of mycofactocin system
VSSFPGRLFLTDHRVDKRGKGLEAESLAIRLRTKRSQMMVDTLEDFALRLFEERGFDAVTVDDIALEAQISPRTFYRYFAAKDDVLQVTIERRSEALRDMLAARPHDEPPVHSLSQALKSVLSVEDPVAVRRWIGVVQATPSALRGVIGGIQLRTHVVIAEFFGSRLEVAADSLVPTMLAAAAGGVIMAAQTQWFFYGGDMAATVSESLEVLESALAGKLAIGGQGQDQQRA